MHHNCEILLTETAVLPLVPGALGRKFEEILFDCMVLSYPGVRFCPGPDCGVIVMALEESSPKRVRVQLLAVSSILSFSSVNLAQQNFAFNAALIFTTQPSARQSNSGSKNAAKTLIPQTTSQRRQRIVQCARAASKNLEVAITSFAASANTSFAGFALVIGKSTEHR